MPFESNDFPLLGDLFEFGGRIGAITKITDENVFVEFSEDDSGWLPLICFKGINVPLDIK